MYYLRNPYAARVALAAAVDALCMASLAALAWFVLEPNISGASFTAMSSVLILGLYFALLYNGAYSPAALGDRHRTSLATLVTMGMGLVAASVFYFWVPVSEDVVPSLAFIAGGFFPLFLGSRGALGMILNMRRNQTRVLILGASDLGLEVSDALRRCPRAGIVPIGFMSDELAYQQHGMDFGGLPVLGRLHELEKVLDDRRVDHIVVASKNRTEHFPKDQLLAAKMRGCRVESGVSYYERLLGRIYLRDLRANYFIFADSCFKTATLSNALKRVVDVVASSIGLICASPILAVCAIGVKLESKGPVLFQQERVGRAGKPFMMMKLRSMRQDAEAGTGAVFTSKGDARITRLGGFLRRTRLDEIPQLWNILRGDMSLVGPRAEREEFGTVLGDRYEYFHLRSAVKPGLTGWAQTRFGYVNDLEAYEQKISLDLYYLLNRSTAMDFMIMLQTVKTVLHFRGM